MNLRLSKAYLTSIRKYGAQPLKAQKNELTKGQLKYSVLPNGLQIISWENLAPVSKIGVFIRAGSRFEKSENIGVTHALRYAAGMSTQSSTIFGITRNIEYDGGYFTASATRDNLIYQLDNIRDYIGKNLKYLSDTVTKPAFKHWQLDDYLYRVKLDVQRAKNDPQTQLLEALHKVSFKGGLSNGLYSPEFMIGKHSTEMLMNYFNKFYLSGRMAVVGLGVDHERFVKEVGEHFNPQSGQGPELVKSKFIGGELRVPFQCDHTFAAVASEGVSTQKFNECIASKIFQNILSVGPRTKYSSGSSRLSQAALKVAKEPFSVNVLNLSYCDSGLFGFTVASSPKEINDIIKAVVSKIRETAKSLTENDLNIAKHQLKSDFYIQLENNDNILEMFGNQALDHKEVKSFDEIIKLIDGLTLNDINNIASKIIKSKGAIVSVGNINNVPYLEDLV